MRPAAVHFSLAALFGFGRAVPIGTAPDPTDVIGIFTDLTTMCEDLKAPASQLSVFNAPLMLVGAGPWSTVVAGLTEIATAITDSIDALISLDGAEEPGGDAAAVAGAAQAYSTAQTGVLDLIARAGNVVKVVPLVGPRMAAAVADVAASVKAAVEAITNVIGDEGDGFEDERVVGKRADDGGWQLQMQAVLNSVNEVAGQLQRVIEIYI